MLFDKGVREERKQRYLLSICAYIHTDVVIKLKKEQIFMAIIVLISVTSLVLKAGIYNYLLQLPILYSLCI